MPSSGFQGGWVDFATKNLLARKSFQQSTTHLQRENALQKTTCRRGKGMTKTILIIGSGMGGLSAGIYGQRMGFQTIIFEAHTRPGGQCTSWKRKGYTFDACLHHLGAGSGRTKFDAFWREVGVLPCEMVATKEVASAVTPDGKYFHDYYDLEELEAHMKELSPQDADLVDQYLEGIRFFQINDRFSDLLMGKLWQKLTYLPNFLRHRTYFENSLGSFGAKFKDPFLRQAFPLLHTSLEQFPLFMHLVKHGYALQGDLGWPRGGSKTVAENMAARYQELGGTIEYGKKVDRILTDDHRACGVQLEDGTRYPGNFVVSNADGRRTILQMLSGQYLSEKISQYCEPNPDDVVPWSVAVYLGVKRDLSSHPSALAMFLEKPVELAGELCDHLHMQIYGFDSSMAPPGNGVIKVELFAKPSHFSPLVDDPEAYNQEKARIAERVIELLETQFSALREDVEVSDVTTLRTWERYMGGTQGYNNFPNQVVVGQENVLASVLGFNQRYTLPGLRNFFFAGSWATSAGSLLMNALSGKNVLKKICRQQGIKFISPQCTGDFVNQGCL